MRTIIAGMILAAGLAAGAALVLNTEVQRSSTEWYQGSGVRL